MATILGALGLGLVGTAQAHEYPLHPVASEVSADGIVVITPKEIDVTRPDYVLIVQFRNDSEQAVMFNVGELRCLRGDYEGPVFPDDEWLYLRPNEYRQREILCDHGLGVTGDFGLVIPRIVTNPYGDRRTPGEPLVEDVVWRLREADVAWDRQGQGEELACLTFRRPASRVADLRGEVEQACSCTCSCAMGEAAPIAAPAPPAPPAPPPPAATLRPRGAP